MNKLRNFLVLVVVIAMASPLSYVAWANDDGTIDNSEEIGGILLGSSTTRADNDAPGEWDLIIGTRHFDPLKESPQLPYGYSAFVQAKGVWNYYLVQFWDGVSGNNIEKIEGMGAVYQDVTFVKYTALFGMDGGLYNDVQLLDEVRSVTPYHSAFKVSQSFQKTAGDSFGYVDVIVLMGIYESEYNEERWDDTVAEYDSSTGMYERWTGAPEVAKQGIMIPDLSNKESDMIDMSPLGKKSSMERLEQVEGVAAEHMKIDTQSDQTSQANDNVYRIKNALDIFNLNRPGVSLATGEPLGGLSGDSGEMDTVNQLAFEQAQKDEEGKLPTTTVQIGYGYDLASSMYIGKGMRVDILSGREDRVELRLPVSLLPDLASVVDILYIGKMSKPEPHVNDVVVTVDAVIAGHPPAGWPDAPVCTDYAYSCYKYGGNNTFIASVDNGWMFWHSEFDSSYYFNSPAANPDRANDPVPIDPNPDGSVAQGGTCPGTMDGSSNGCDSTGKFWAYYYDATPADNWPTGFSGDHGTATATFAVARDNGEFGISPSGLGGNIHEITGVAPEALFIGQEHGYMARLAFSTDDTVNFPGIYNAVDTAKQFADSNGIPLAAHFNSWGDPSGDDTYDDASEAVDDAVMDLDTLIVFSSGNSQLANLDGYCTAKNVVCVGTYGMNNDNDPSNDWAAIYDTDGPTADYRMAPHILGSGGDMTSDHYHADLGGNFSAVGDGENGYSGWGTSYAAPVVAGVASIYHDFFQSIPEGGFSPSPALLKAMLLISAEAIIGGEDGYTCCTNQEPGATYGLKGTIPNDQQGWGGVVASIPDLYHIDGAINMYDEKMVDNDISRGNDPNIYDGGETWTYYFRPYGNFMDMRVMVVWTDPAADWFTGTGRALRNDLDLYVVDPSGNYYHGNDFTSANPGYTQSTPSLDDSRFDRFNNTEGVYIFEPSNSENWQVVVRSATPAGPGYDAEQGGLVNQPFAIVCTGSVGAASIKFLDTKVVPEAPPPGVLPFYGYYNTLDFTIGHGMVTDRSNEDDLTVEVQLRSQRDPIGLTLEWDYLEFGFPFYSGYWQFNDECDISVGDILCVFPEDLINLTYVDTNPAGAMVRAWAMFDGLAPILSNVSLAKIQMGTAFIHLEPHEPAYTVFKIQDQQTLAWEVRDTFEYHSTQRYLFTNWRVGALDQYLDYRVQIRSYDYAGNVRYWQWLEFRTPLQDFTLLYVQDYQGSDFYGAGGGGTGNDFYVFNNYYSPYHMADDLAYIGFDFDIWNMGTHTRGISDTAGAQFATNVYTATTTTHDGQYGPTPAFLANYDVVIWNTCTDGWYYRLTGVSSWEGYDVDGTVTANNQQSLMTYMSNPTPNFDGGRAWVIGSHVASDIAEAGGWSETWGSSGRGVVPLTHSGFHQSIRMRNSGGSLDGEGRSWLEDYMGVLWNGQEWASDFEDVPYDKVSHRFGYDDQSRLVGDRISGGSRVFNGGYKGSMRDWDDPSIGLDFRGGTNSRNPSIIDYLEGTFYFGAYALHEQMDDLIPNNLVYTKFDWPIPEGSMQRPEDGVLQNFPIGYDVIAVNEQGYLEKSCNPYLGECQVSGLGAGTNWNQGHRYWSNNYTAILHWSDENMTLDKGFRTYFQAFAYNSFEAYSDDAWYDGTNLHGDLWLTKENHHRDRGTDWILRVINWLAPQPTVSGHVRSESTGRPIFKALVNAYEYYDGVLNFTRPVAGSITDADGYYELNSLSPGKTYAIQAHGVGYMEEWYEEKTSEDLPDLIYFAANDHSHKHDVNFTLDSGVMFGWVYDIDGPVYDSVAKSVAVLLYVNHSGERAELPHAIEHTDSTGFYYFQGLSSGEYDLVIREHIIEEQNQFTGELEFITWNRMYYPNERNRLTVHFLEDTGPINFHMTRKGAKLEGNLYDDVSSDPLVVEWVRAFGTTQNIYYITQTDQDGHYTFKALPADTYEMTVGSGAQWRYSDGVDVGSEHSILDRVFVEPIGRSEHYSYVDATPVILGAAEWVQGIDFLLKEMPQALIVNDNGWINVTREAGGLAGTYTDAADYTSGHRGVMDDMGYTYLEWHVGNPTLADTELHGIPNATNTNLQKARMDGKDRQWPIIAEFERTFWVTGDNEWASATDCPGSTASSANANYLGTVSTLTNQPGGEWDTIYPYMTSLSGMVFFEGAHLGEDLNQTGWNFLPGLDMAAGLIIPEYRNLWVAINADAGYDAVTDNNWNEAGTSLVGDPNYPSCTDNSPIGCGITTPYPATNDGDVWTPWSYLNPDWSGMGTWELSYNSWLTGDAAMVSHKKNEGFNSYTITVLGDNYFTSAYGGGNCDVASEAFGCRQVMYRLMGGVGYTDNNDRPTLTNPKVTPQFGVPENVYTWTVTYTDKNGDNPRAGGHVRLYIDGSIYFDMERDRRIGGTLGDNDMTNGEQFILDTTDLGWHPWEPAAGHTYQIKADDGNGTAYSLTDWTPELPGPYVGAAKLERGTLTPIEQIAGLEFQFEVVFTEANNEPPAFVEVLLQREDGKLFGPFELADKGGVGVLNDGRTDNGETYQVILDDEITLFDPTQDAWFNYTFVSATGAPTHLQAQDVDGSTILQNGPHLIPSAAPLDEIIITPDKKFTYSGFDEKFTVVGKNSDSSTNLTWEPALNSWDGSDYDRDFSDWQIDIPGSFVRAPGASNNKTVILLNGETDDFGIITVKAPASEPGVLDGVADIYVTPVYHLQREVGNASSTRELTLHKADGGIGNPAATSTVSRIETDDSSYYIESWSRTYATETNLDGVYKFDISGIPTLGTRTETTYAHLYANARIESGPTLFSTHLQAADDEDITFITARRTYHWEYEYTGGIVIGAGQHLIFDIYVRSVETSNVTRIDEDVFVTCGRMYDNQANDGCPPSSGATDTYYEGNFTNLVAMKTIDYDSENPTTYGTFQEGKIGYGKYYTDWCGFGCAVEGPAYMYDDYLIMGFMRILEDIPSVGGMSFYYNDQVAGSVQIRMAIYDLVYQDSTAECSGDPCATDDQGDPLGMQWMPENLLMWSQTETHDLGSMLDEWVELAWEGGQVNLPAGDYGIGYVCDGCTDGGSHGYTVDYNELPDAKWGYSFVDCTGTLAQCGGQVDDAGPSFPALPDPYNAFTFFTNIGYSPILSRITGAGDLYGMDVELEIQNVDTADDYFLDMYYDSTGNGENFWVDAYDWNTSASCAGGYGNYDQSCTWDVLSDVIPQQMPGTEELTLRMPLDTDHRSLAGTVIIRIRGERDNPLVGFSDSDGVQSQFNIDYVSVNSYRSEVIPPYFWLHYDETPIVYGGADSWITMPIAPSDLDSIDLDPYPQGYVLDGGTLEMITKGYDENYADNITWTPLWSVESKGGNAILEGSNPYDRILRGTFVGDVEITVCADDPASPGTCLSTVPAVTTTISVLPALYLHVQTGNGDSGEQDLKRGVAGDEAYPQLKPTDASFNTPGDFKIGEWVSEPYTATAELDGEWRFIIYGNVSEYGTLAEGGHLFAKVYNYDVDQEIPMFTTGLDDQDVMDFPLFYQFMWSYEVSPGVTIAQNERLMVEFYVNVTTGGHRDPLDTWSNITSVTRRVDGGFSNPLGIADLQTKDDGNYVEFSEIDVQGPIMRQSSPLYIADIMVDNYTYPLLEEIACMGVGCIQDNETAWVTVDLYEEGYRVYNVTLLNGTNRTDDGNYTVGYTWFENESLEIQGHDEPLINVRDSGHGLILNITWSRNASYDKGPYHDGTDGPLEPDAMLQWRCVGCGDTPGTYDNWMATTINFHDGGTPNPDWCSSVGWSGDEWIYTDTCFEFPQDIDDTNDLGNIEIMFNMTDDNATGNYSYIGDDPWVFSSDWTQPAIHWDWVHIQAWTDPYVYDAYFDVSVRGLDWGLETYYVEATYMANGTEGDGSEGITLMVYNWLWGQWFSAAYLTGEVGVWTTQKVPFCDDAAKVYCEDYVSMSGEVMLRFRAQRTDYDPWNTTMRVDHVVVTGDTPEKFGPTFFMAYDNDTVSSGIAPAERYPPSITLNLVDGWNFVSTSIIPNDSSIAKVMAGLQESDTFIAMQYNASVAASKDAWKSYSSMKVGSMDWMNDLTDLGPKEGFWLRTYQSGATPPFLLVYGDAPSADLRIPLYPGWNMIGYSVDTDTTHSVEDAFGATLAASVTVFEQGTPGSHGVNKITDEADDTAMQRTRGYWVYNEGAGVTWIVSPEGLWVDTQAL